MTPPRVSLTWPPHSPPLILVGNHTTNLLFKSCSLYPSCLDSVLPALPSASVRRADLASVPSTLYKRLKEAGPGANTQSTKAISVDAAITSQNKQHCPDHKTQWQIYVSHCELFQVKSIIEAAQFPLPAGIYMTSFRGKNVHTYLHTDMIVAHLPMHCD